MQLAKVSFFFLFQFKIFKFYYVEFTLIFIVFTLVDLERQRTTYEAHINKAAPTELPATKSPTTDAPTLNDHNLIHGDDLQGYEETATPILNDQASEGVITLMDESTLLKTRLSRF